MIFIVGDGDFFDMVKLLQETFKRNVFMFAWSESLDNEIPRLVKPTYLDLLFLEISQPGQRARPTNADRLRGLQEIENFKNRDLLIEAATHKFPDEHDYDNCVMFAI